MIGRSDAKSRAASLSASVASIDFPPIVMRTRVAEDACLSELLCSDDYSWQFLSSSLCARDWISADAFRIRLCRRHGREHVGPTDIEGEMCQGFCDLDLGQTVVHPDLT